MAKVNRDIKEKFKLYKELVSKLKHSVNNFIFLAAGSGSHRKWLSGEVRVDFIRNFKGRLAIRQAKSQLIDYGFQVFVSLFEQPILRFDADGATHYNSRDDTIPLLEREIKTPHFHKFDEDGIEYAYRTSYLIEHEYQIQNDIQSGLNHFCEEHNIRSNSEENESNGPSNIKVNTQQEIFPEIITNDVHKGIKFT